MPALQAWDLYPKGKSVQKRKCSIKMNVATTLEDTRCDQLSLQLYTVTVGDFFCQRFILPAEVQREIATLWFLLLQCHVCYLFCVLFFVCLFVLIVLTWTSSFQVLSEDFWWQEYYEQEYFPSMYLTKKASVQFTVFSSYTEELITRKSFSNLICKLVKTITVTRT